MSDIDTFEATLKELPTLRAPGVSGTRIKKLTDLAVKNVAAEPQLVSVLYSSCKATPSSHKLGALYVVDSIVRVYMDEAKKRGQEVGPQAPEGTFAAGVNRIGELVESIIDDAMQLSVLPATAAKIGKLVDIWERASTFSKDTIRAIRKKHFDSLTPKGSPAGQKSALSAPAPQNGAAGAIPAATDSGSILSALASLAKKSETPTPPQTATPVAGSAGTNSAPAPAPAANANATNILSQLSALAGNGTPPVAHSQVHSPPAPAPAAAQPGNKEYIFNMLQQMQSGNSPANVSAAVSAQGTPQGMPAVPHMQQQGFQNQNHQGYQNQNQNQGYQDQGFQNGQNATPQSSSGSQYDRRGRDDLGGYSRRNRSRSPQGRFNRYDQGQGQGQDQGYQNQNQNSYGQNQGYQNQDYGQGNSGYESRAPPRHNGPTQFGPAGEQNVPDNVNFRPRNMGFDNTLPQGSFKVLSRTLFIGGVPRGMDERELASLLRPHAIVQSVILNSERKHAFVKVYSRKEAEQVVQSFNKDGSLPLRTRWGVGFGPRDCCNYQHGISIIPIERLTDADRSWVVSAQWGGTGGIPLASGMVMDEPDIEIGTGISSKAMSKKMPTNSTRNGPKSNRPGESDEPYARGHNAGGAPTDFRGYNQGPNPLSGLFANQAPQQGGFSPQMAQQMPQMQQMQQGFPPQGNYGGPPAGQNYGGPNANIGAQLSNFFQNGN